MNPHTAICTVGPLFPVVKHRFPTREACGQWVSMVDKARYHVSERGGASRELQMSWTTDEQMVQHMGEFFRQLKNIARTFGIQMVPPDVYCAAQTGNRILVSLGRPRQNVLDEEASVPPRHAGCEILGIYDAKEYGRGRLVPFQP